MANLRHGRATLLSRQFDRHHTAQLELEFAHPHVTVPARPPSSSRASGRSRWDSPTCQYPRSSATSPYLSPCRDSKPTLVATDTMPLRLDTVEDPAAAHGPIDANHEDRLARCVRADVPHRQQNGSATRWNGLAARRLDNNEHERQTEHEMIQGAPRRSSRQSTSCAPLSAYRKTPNG